MLAGNQQVGNDQGYEPLGTGHNDFRSVIYGNYHANRKEHWPQHKVAAQARVCISTSWTVFLVSGMNFFA